MLSPDSYEADFFAALHRAFKSWRQTAGINFANSVDEMELIKGYLEILSNFLGVDVQEVERIYTSKYNGELINLFLDNYSFPKLTIFVAFVVHLILEENMSLLLTHIEPTGNYYGHWGTGYVSNRNFMGIDRLIERRIQFSVGRDGMADSYRDRYLGQSTSGKILSEETSQDKNSKLLGALIGAGAATIFLSTLARYARRVFRVWVPSDDNTQTMFALGYAPGSVKFYGFCTEKPKYAPNPSVTFTPMYREQLADEQKQIYDKIPDYLEFFERVLDIQDEQTLQIAKENPSIIWETLQHFFWLITQPYYDQLPKREEIIKDFLFSGSKLVVMDDYDIEGDDWGISIFPFEIISAKVMLEFDSDKANFVRDCVQILNQCNIPIPENNNKIVEVLTEELAK